MKSRVVVVFGLLVLLSACGSQENTPPNGDTETLEQDSDLVSEGDQDKSETDGGESACRPSCINNVAIGCVNGKERRQDCNQIIGGGECTIGISPDDVFCSGIDHPHDGDGDSDLES